MPRVHGKDLASLSIHTQSMLADTVELNFKVSAESHDTTTMGDDWREFTAGLLGGDEFDHVVMYDNTASTGSWAKYTSILGGSSGTVTFGDGTRTVSVSTVVIALSLPIQVGDMMKITATHKITGQVTFS